MRLGAWSVGTCSCQRQMRIVCLLVRFDPDLQNSGISSHASVPLSCVDVPPMERDTALSPAGKPFQGLEEPMMFATLPRNRGLRVQQSVA